MARWSDMWTRWRRSPAKQNGYGQYKSTVFIDSNVVLEGKPFVDLPWSDVDAEGPILVLLLPQVLREIDSKKRDGRLEKQARAFNRLMAPAAVSGVPLNVRPASPSIDIVIARCDRVPWSAYDDLDPGDGDSRVVAEMLHCQDVPDDRKVLIRNDINPIAMASRRA